MNDLQELASDKYPVSEGVRVRAAKLTEQFSLLNMHEPQRSILKFSSTSNSSVRIS